MGKVMRFKKFVNFTNEEYIYSGDKICLEVVFNNEEQYLNAINFFNSESSDFTPDELNNEFRSISFDCDNQKELDSLEIYIEKELIDNGFESYYFEQS